MFGTGRRRRLVAAVAVAAAALPAGGALAAPGDVTVAKVAEIHPTGSAQVASITDVNGIVFFRAGNGATPGQNPPQFGEELYRSDGSAAGTFIVEDINTADGVSSDPRDLTDVNGTLLFIADDGINGAELWRSDGTAPGTAMVEDINPDPGQSSNPVELVNADGTLYFAASNGTDPSENGTELWKSEPPYDESSTAMVEDIRTGNLGSGPNDLAAVGNQVFFSAVVDSAGREPWRSDGTPGGTDIVEDIAPTTEDSEPGEFTPVGSTVYFAAGTNSEPEDEANVELWKSLPPYDTASTTMVKDINMSNPAGSNPSELIAFNGKLVFSAQDGPDGAENREPWVSDGSDGGTVKLAEINGGGDSGPEDFTALGGTLFFAADDGPAHGRELWRTDGTPVGTSLAVDVMPGTAGSGSVGLTVVGSDIFFSANADAAGRELWRTNGGPLGAGTARVSDIAPGPGNGLEGFITNVGGAIFMKGDDSGIDTNFELWKATIEPAPPAPPASPAAPAAPAKKKCKKGQKLKKGKCVKKKRKKRRK